MALDLKFDHGKFLVFSLEKGAEFQGKLNLIETLSEMPVSNYAKTINTVDGRSKSNFRNRKGSDAISDTGSAFQ